LAAVDASLELSSLGIASFEGVGHSEDASCEESKDWDEELHFEDFGVRLVVVGVWCVESLVYCVVNV
jgi:hypothetical protein